MLALCTQHSPWAVRARFRNLGLRADVSRAHGRVVDEAGILDPAAKTALEQKLADFETKTTGQLVVVTLKSLQGTSIEDYGYQLGRHWQIGQKGKNSGAILIVAPNETYCGTERA